MKITQQRYYDTLHNLTHTTGGYVTVADVARKRGVHVTSAYEYLKDVNNFKYCPFCGYELRSDELQKPTGKESEE